MKIKASLLSLLLMLGGTYCYAQLSKNPNKFLGNITTMGSIRSDFSNYWNQLTPENETKWASIEGTRDVYNWTAVDRQYQYCKDHNFPFKFHCLIWGAQYPTWLNNLSQKEQLEEITEWFDEVAKRYPDLDYIDVVNEAVPGHQPAPYKNALGGDGASGYDWIVNSFIMARERWPKAVLIYNDYNTFQWNTDAYITLLKKIVAAGAPVDAAGCQAHDLNDMSGAAFKTVLEKIHNQTGLPILISEYDINQQDDQVQLTRYKEQIPVMWEADYVAGVTIWGYIYGSTWVDHSGLIKNGVERPALKWLRDYMLTDAAINAKSPLMNVGEYAFISALESMVEINAETTIKGKAHSEKDSIAEIQVYLNDSLLSQTSDSMFELKWTPSVAGDYTFTMKVLNSADSIIFQRSCVIRAYEPSTPFRGEPITLPGILEVEDFDNGINGVAYSDSDDRNEGGKYRTDCGVDIDTIAGGGYVVGWTATGEWLKYTVKVEEEQLMVFSAKVASGLSGSAFRIYMGDIDITGRVNVPQTASSNWTVYTEVKGRTKVAMPAGTYTLRLVIEGPYCNIDKITFEKSTGDEVLTTPYGTKPIAIPGTMEIEFFDRGIEGIAYKDNDSNNRGDAEFRTDCGVDIVNGNGGRVLGYTEVGEWLLYTVTVEREQVYYWTAYVSSGVTGSAFRIYMGDTDITGIIQVPRTGNNNWNTYTQVSGKTLVALPEGTYQLRLVIEGASCNIDKIIFRTESTGIHSMENDKSMEIKAYPNPTTDYLIIENPGLEIKTIEVVDMKGATIIQRKVSEQKITIETNSVKPGFYMLKAIKGDKVITQLITKN
ncbi:MAG: endo-1,4-beta-xylanase [Prolixibacteraceae bacterium]|jgi:GH35 family endo-1,4-beta-xylanase|nr:endo-1,4-beta-xylanase [Prolixibacteraceae bacterium]MDI9564396.1 endo-1,4-beta-xylanase [Bacteroidota bacterium]NLT00753.1 carbohydrate-binding protein [Bacteroidales bacterium]OQB78372.1 MAG: Endo-1,4-beta-xylanase B precursor [Bacteroidetes bacterium ADurb.Bin123]HOC87751.1 endo-1,4-beta-xylanase [Prolixibacteraceae bacterium]